MNLAKILGVAAITSIAYTARVDAITIYGNSASGGNNPISTINSTTGQETQRFIGQPSGNGRGVVTVGNTIYYTVVGDPNIYKTDLSGNPIGSILTPNSSMSTIAWDGKYFWTSDYSGTNRAFQIDPTTGLNIKTITLSNAQNFMDGLEYFNGKLISNRCDACGVYDIYDTNGNLLQAAFITAPSNATGIAYDGTDFYVSNIFNSSIGVYDGVLGTLKSTINLTPKTPGDTFLIEDLSVDYAQRPDTGGQSVPEPSSVFGLLGLAAWGAMSAFKLKLKPSKSTKKETTKVG